MRRQPRWLDAHIRTDRSQCARPAQCAALPGFGIEVHFDTGQVVLLEKGDSLYFDSSSGHAYITVSRQLAKVVGVTSSESAC